MKRTRKLKRKNRLEEVEIAIEPEGKIWFLPVNAPLFRKRVGRKQLLCG